MVFETVGNLSEAWGYNHYERKKFHDYRFWTCCGRNTAGLELFWVFVRKHIGKNYAKREKELQAEIAFELSEGLAVFPCKTVVQGRSFRVLQAPAVIIFDIAKSLQVLRCILWGFRKKMSRPEFIVQL